MSTQSSPVTGHPVLRPGVHVLRRDATTLQVGLDPTRAVVLPDTATVREVIRALRSPASVTPAATYDVDTLDLLAASGLLVDADRLLPLMPWRDGDEESNAAGASRTGIAAVAAEAGDETADLLARRAATRVEVRSCGAPGVATVVDTVTGLLTRCGVPWVTRPGRAPEHRETAEPGVIGLLVAVGEPARELVDPWTRAGTPHLLLRLIEGHALVGPFVEPGTTACLRCVDAHHTDADPSWPLLVAQHAAAVGRARDDTLPEPLDPTLAMLAASWTARELVSRAEGRTPATASTTVRLDPHLTCLETHCWPRHPACGCGWA